MRLWSIHPSYLDAKGLVALWREGLLAQNILLGKTKGYQNHPQLIRFKKADSPQTAIGCYLKYVADEADLRGYAFDKTKIINDAPCEFQTVTEGQLAYEFEHLLKKLQKRDPERYEALKSVQDIKTHPLFRKVPGDVESWEVIS